MSALTAALWITLIGMGLVFLALLALWALMALMAKIPSGEKSLPDAAAVVSQDDIPTLADTPPLPDAGAAGGARRQAAALAVAVALAMRQAAHSLQLTDRQQGNVSIWQAVQRANRISQRNMVFSRKRGSAK